MIEDGFRVWTPITQEQMAEIDAKFGLKLPKCMKVWEGQENDEVLYNSIISAIRSEYASKFS